MLRPNNGCDFRYDEDQMEIILHDMEMLNDLGADGFVFGSLDNRSKIHESNCMQVRVVYILFGAQDGLFELVFRKRNVNVAK